MIPSIIIIISLLLDGIFTNYLPYLVNDLSFLTPLLTIVTIFIIYPFYKKNEKKYFIIIFILGIIYDLLYTNLLFFNGVVFIIIGVITKYINKNFEINYLKLILYIIIIITSYELISGTILFIYNMVPVTLPKLIYKITHSILLNIIYGEFLYFIIRRLPKKYSKISIN